MNRFSCGLLLTLALFTSACGTGEVEGPEGTEGILSQPAELGSQPAPLWLRHEVLPLSEFAGGAATNGAGGIFTAATHGITNDYSPIGEGGLQLRVSRFAPDGHRLWVRTFPVVGIDRPIPDLSGSIQAKLAYGAGGIYLLGTVFGEVRFGTSTVRDASFLARLDADGHPIWVRKLGAGDEPTALASDTAGNVYLGLRSQRDATEGSCALTEGVIWSLTSFNSTRWRRSIGGRQCGGDRADILALSVGPQGQLLVGGSFSGTLQFASGDVPAPTGQSIPFLGVLSPSAELRWFRSLPTTSGSITDIGGSALGTVVAVGVHRAHEAGSTGQISWGSDRLLANDNIDRGFLLVAEPNGAARWGRDLDHLDAPVLAVEPLGSAVVSGVTRAGNENDPRLFATRYNLAGQHLWTREFPRGNGPADLYTDAVVRTLDAPDSQGDAFLFGQLSHPADFGTGERVPVKTDLFLLRLQH